MSETYYCKPGTGSDAARSTQNIASSTKATPIVITIVGHGLDTGDNVTIAGHVTNTYANGTWRITKVNDDTFSLDNSYGGTNAGGATGTVVDNGGRSWADAWKTLTHVLSDGDEILVQKSEDPIAASINATFTNKSENVTLGSAITANICTCESAWTSDGGTNVVPTADVTYRVEGSYAEKFVIKAAFTTGLAAHFATGTLDLSSYQQVSMMIYTLAAVNLAAGAITMGLCTNNDGTGEVHTLTFPAIASAAAQFIPLVFDTGGAMNSAIESINLKVVTDLGAADFTFYVDNIIACTAPANQNCLTHQSLISTPPLTRWIASTAYSVNDLRRPKASCFCNMYYKCTVGGTSGATPPATWPHFIGDTVTDGGVTWECMGFQDRWYAIRSINGTAVKLNHGQSYSTIVSRGYYGTGGDVVLWIRKCLFHDCLAISAATTFDAFQSQASNASPCKITGGYNITNDTIEGETLISLYSGRHSGFIMTIAGRVKDVIIKGIGYWHHYRSWDIQAVNGIDARNLLCDGFLGNITIQGSLTGCCRYSFLQNTGAMSFSNLIYKFMSNAGNYGGVPLYITSFSGSKFQGILQEGCTAYGTYFYGNVGSSLANNFFEEVHVVNCTTFSWSLFCLGRGNIFKNCVSADNGTGAISLGTGADITFINSLFGTGVECTPYNSSSVSNSWVISQDHNQYAGVHRMFALYAQIDSTIVTRHTASGIAWQIAPTSTVYRTATNPVIPPFEIYAKCVEDLETRVGIWVNRSHADINCKFYLEDHCGVALSEGTAEISDTASGALPGGDGWEELYFTFTPTENGLVKLNLAVWGGSSYTVTVDDFSQADV